jgi:hypothetical protein
LRLENAPADAPRSLTVKVEHKEPALKYTASGETSSGDPFTETAELTTDGKAHPFRSELQGTITAHWEGEALLIRADLKSIQVTQTVNVRLSSDGKRMFRDVTTKTGEGENTNKEIYDKEQN